MTETVEERGGGRPRLVRNALTRLQEAKARKLRAEGKGYKEIKETLHLRADEQALRRLLDDVVPTAGRLNFERRAPGAVEATNRTIRFYAAEEDDELIAWNDADPAERGSLNTLAKRMGRKRHSLLARLKSLKRRGRIVDLHL